MGGSRRAPGCTVADQLAAAGGGRPGTGYVGLAAAAHFAQSGKLSGGWGLDANYTHSFADRFSAELSLGLLRYDIEDAGGELRTTTIGALAQFGRPFGAERWYVGAGLSYWLNDGSGLAADAENATAALVTAGVDLPLSGSADLCLEFRYTLCEISLAGGDELDAGGLTLRVNYVFLY